MATPASYDVNVKEQTGRELVRNGVKYSMADQVARFANAKATNNARYLDITTVYDPTPIKGMRILITGAEQGLGFELVKEIVKQGGHAIQAGREVRVMIDADRVSDDEAYLIAHDIAKRVSDEMTFPGEIKVTVLREIRTIDYAR